MLRINQIKLPITHSESDLKNKIQKILNISNDFTYEICKKSIDARKKPELFFVYSVRVSCKNENTILKKCRNSSVMEEKAQKYSIPENGDIPLKKKPIIVGAGPAGLFCAYLLVQKGFSPILIERGKPVEDRMKDVNDFWEMGRLLPDSNVQFGEGGAGTFSDGKLNTAVKDPSKRILFVLETFVKFGAPKEILYENKPHIGTDILVKVIQNIRSYLLEMGCTILFNHCMTDLVIKENRIQGIRIHQEELECDVLVLALGHSARDTFQMLEKHKVEMQVKQFAVGFRIEHPQKMIDSYMYGVDNRNNLPPSSYKLTSNFPNGRGVYSFCMCPGGYVVNASSIENKMVVNGMSYANRDSRNANSAIIVSVGPNDFPNKGPLSGMYFQDELEKKAYKLGNGKIPQQLYIDFCNDQKSTKYGQVVSCTKGNACFTNLRGLFSEEIETAFIQGVEHFSKIIPGFNRNDAVLSGVESRTSSPIRIIRNEDFENSIAGLYPCGEGAGYAGGITSAAMDGMKVAEAIISKYYLSV